MKKLFTIILASLMVAGFAACSPKGNDTSSSEAASSNASVVSEVSDTTDSADTNTDTNADTPDDASSDFEAPDTSEMSNPFVFEGFAIDLPEGFSEGEGIGGVATVTPDDYPTHSDNFTFVSSPFNGDKSSYSKEAIEELYSQSFSDFSGMDQFEEVDVDGHNAIISKYTVSYMDIEMTQQQLYVFTEDKVYVMSFTCTSDDYSDAFDNAYKTVKIAD